jgi:hypothetical protein
VTEGATGATQNGTAALTPVSELYKLTLDGPAAAKPGQGLELVYFSAQRTCFLRDRGSI